MTRKRMHGDGTLHSAFLALGPAPSRRELALVAEALRKGDREALADLDAASVGDREALDRLCETASAAGSSAFVALDLAVAHGSGIDALVKSGPRARVR